MSTKTIMSIFIIPLLFLISCNKQETETPTLIDNNTESMYTLENDDIVAVMKTSNGSMKIKLFTDLVPKTTTNFIGLATK
jgi:hypothetical protein